MGESGIAPAQGSPQQSSAVTLEAIDGPERALLLPFAHLVLVLPPAAEEDVATVVVQWFAGAPLEIPLPGSTLWRTALVYRLNQIDGDDEIGEVEAELLRVSLGRFPTLQAWWHWLATGWLAAPRRGRDVRK